MNSFHLHNGKSLHFCDSIFDHMYSLSYDSRGRTQTRSKWEEKSRNFSNACYYGEKLNVPECVVQSANMILAQSARTDRRSQEN